MFKDKIHALPFCKSYTSYRSREIQDEIAQTNSPDMRITEKANRVLCWDSTGVKQGRNCFGDTPDVASLLTCKGVFLAQKVTDS